MYIITLKKKQMYKLYKYNLLKYLTAFKEAILRLKIKNVQNKFYLYALRLKFSFVSIIRVVIFNTENDIGAIRRMNEYDICTVLYIIYNFVYIYVCVSILPELATTCNNPRYLTAFIFLRLHRNSDL